MSILETLKSVLPNHNISLKEFFYLGTLFYPASEEEKARILVKHNIPTRDSEPRVFPIHTKKFMSIISEAEVLDSSDLKKLAAELKEIYPKGKKPNTSYYWAEGGALIEARLKLFFRKFGYYDPEEIIDATKRYVDSFNGDYAYMRTLKYFIFKDVKGDEGIEKSSDLLNFIENKNEITQDNWDNVELC
jgi:hypothetical protein|nr:MAG TPA: hypothetical protein [Bacteriophage sp.]